MTVTVPVPLGARAYDIRIGEGLLPRAGAEIAPLLRRPRLAVVTEDSRRGASHEAMAREIVAAVRAHDHAHSAGRPTLEPEP